MVKGGEDFRLNYARAREDQAHFYCDQITDLAEQCPGNNESIQKTRLDIDTKKWEREEQERQRQKELELESEKLGAKVVRLS